MTDYRNQTELENKNNPQQAAGYYLILSLFLLLLAFFILFIAISNRAEVKSRAVMNSLLSTFRTEVSSQSAQTLLSRVGATPEPEELVNEMSRLWVTAVPIAEVEILTDGKSMLLRLPANMIFPGGAALLRKDRRDLVGDVATILATEAPGFSNELELLVGTDWQAGQEFDLKKNNLEIQRAVEFADELISGGAPRESVSIGLTEGDGKELEFRFYVRSKMLARVEFQQFSE